MTDLQISIGNTIRDNDERHKGPGGSLRTGTVADVKPHHVVVDWNTGKSTMIQRSTIYVDNGVPRKGKYTLVGKAEVAA